VHQVLQLLVKAPRSKIKVANSQALTYIPNPKLNMSQIMTMGAKVIASLAVPSG
jgi:hypothetical protein